MVLAAAVAVVAAQLHFTYAPFINALFDSRPLALSDWEVVAGVGIAIFILMEGEKILTRRMRKETSQWQPKGGMILVSQPARLKISRE